ncbi:MAG: helix-turn-helix domain-containing protein [Calditrichaceae bacterium]
MKNIIIGKRVKELRMLNGLSQENLAEKSNLNLRTIQRVESGSTIPRGDTLLRISTALDVNPKELLNWTKVEDKGQLLLINLSGLSIIINPFFGIIIPLILWVSKKDKISYADETGKELLNFQMTWLIILIIFITLYIFFVLMFFKMDATGTINSPTAAIIILVFIGFYYLYSLGLIIKNTLRIQRNLKVKYNPAFKILK